MSFPNRPVSLRAGPVGDCCRPLRVQERPGPYADGRHDLTLAGFTSDAAAFTSSVAASISELAASAWGRDGSALNAAASTKDLAGDSWDPAGFARHLADHISQPAGSPSYLAASVSKAPLRYWK
jgi:hypothetical protein